MFHKTLIIYLALLIGIGTDPCCCARAWFADGFVATVLGPLASTSSAGKAATSELEMNGSDQGAANADLGCCASLQRQSVEEENRESKFETSRLLLKPNLRISGNSQQSCCQKSASSQSKSESETHEKNSCGFESCAQCGCSSANPLETLVIKQNDVQPIDLQVWGQLDIESIQVADSSYRYANLELASNTSSLQPLLCRWNC